MPPMNIARIKLSRFTRMYVRRPSEGRTWKGDRRADPLADGVPQRGAACRGSGVRPISRTFSPKRRNSISMRFQDHRGDLQAWWRRSPIRSSRRCAVRQHSRTRPARASALIWTRSRVMTQRRSPRSGSGCWVLGKSTSGRRPESTAFLSSTRPCSRLADICILDTTVELRQLETRPDPAVDVFDACATAPSTSASMLAATGLPSKAQTSGLKVHRFRAL